MGDDTARPNVLVVMTDQQRFDTIASLGNDLVYTPNLDRLAARGVAFTQAYSCCPVCVPARYTLHSGCESPRTGIWSNETWPDVHADVRRACGPYLPETMRAAGYRTFGIGKFHTRPWDAPLGYEVHLRSEELYEDPAQRSGDAYASWISREHPEFDFLEQLMGERTEMYYIPQLRPLPAELTVESWAANRAVEQLGVQDGRPFFGMVSFIAPHPPLSPPVPYNRAYDPDRMPPPVVGDRVVDHLDQQIPLMNYGVWADDVSDAQARVVKARYYAEISHVDHCVGRVLDALDAREDAANTLVIFCSDHGDHLGDHAAWQKESFFEAACKVPLLVSWPARLDGGRTNGALVSLADVFATATSAAGVPENRDGIDLVGLCQGTATARETLVGAYGRPGTDHFKVMVRQDDWKYIHIACGGYEQLFDVGNDPSERVQLAGSRPDVAGALHSEAVAALAEHDVRSALQGERLRSFPFRHWPRERIYQFDESREVAGFPAHPADLLGRSYASRRERKA